MLARKTDKIPSRSLRTSLWSIAASLGIALGCHASPVEVALICAKGVDCAWAVERVNEATELLTQDTGVVFVEYGIAVTNTDYCPSIGEPRTGFWKFWWMAANRSRFDPDLVVVLTTTPSLCPGLDWEDAFGIIGRADSLGGLWYNRAVMAPALVYTRLTGDDLMATQVIAHEIAHTIGATHTDIGLMKRAASMMDGLERLSDWSRLEILIARLRATF